MTAHWKQVMSPAENVKASMSGVIKSMYMIIGLFVGLTTVSVRIAGKPTASTTTPDCRRAASAQQSATTSGRNSMILSTLFIQLFLIA
jgi:hypothetical protein